MTSPAGQLRTHVEILAATTRKPGTAEHAKARNYVRRHLQEAGFAITESAHETNDGTAINLYGENAPVDESLPLLVVGAHYDTIPNSPGADDNASAVAALIELAKWIGPRLQGTEQSARLQLVAYDLEEYGLIGSACHCEDLLKQSQKLRGMISLEMLGYTDDEPGSQELPPFLADQYPDVANFIGVVGNQNSQDLLQTVVEEMKTVDGLPVEFLAVPGDGTMIPETRLSDHSSFWDRGCPALMITDTSFFRNPHYHKSSDTPETLDYEFLAKVTQGVCAAVWKLVS